MLSGLIDSTVFKRCVCQTVSVPKELYVYNIIQQHEYANIGQNQQRLRVKGSIREILSYDSPSSAAHSVYSHFWQIAKTNRKLLMDLIKA